MTIDNNSRLKIEIDIDWVVEMSDKFRGQFK